MHKRKTTATSTKKFLRNSVAEIESKVMQDLKRKTVAPRVSAISLSPLRPRKTTASAVLKDTELDTLEEIDRAQLEWDLRHRITSLEVENESLRTRVYALTMRKEENLAD